MKFGLNRLLCFIAGVLFVILGVLAFIIGKHILLATLSLIAAVFDFHHTFTF